MASSATTAVKPPPNYDGMGFSTGNINNNGDYVAHATTKAFTSDGYIFKNGAYTPLNYSGAASTMPLGINDQGTVVGGYRNTAGNIDPDHAFIYDGAKFTEVSIPGAEYASLDNINNNGVAVGSYALPKQPFHGLIYANGQTTTLDYPGASGTSIRGINDAGVMVGSYDDAALKRHGFVYSNGSFRTLDRPGYDHTVITDINNNDEMIGSSYNNNADATYSDFSGFIYRNGKFEALPDEATGLNDAGQIITTKSIYSTDALCFVAGTLIRTVRGDVPVEALVVGDLAETASGGLRPVRWLGHRTLHCTAEAAPVQVRAGAFGAGLPERDLYLSPGHPVLVGANVDHTGGVLVPVMCLVNGTTITRTAPGRVSYWHVELDAHDLLLAEGLPAESYHELGSRAWFEGADGALIDPDFVPAGENGRCRPVAVEGPVVEAERLRLSGVFAAALGAQCGWDEANSFAWLAA